MALISEEQAQEVSRLTVQWLKNRGWCFWKCEALGGDTIAVARNQTLAEEQAYDIQLAARDRLHIEHMVVHYTQDELRNLARLDDNTMKLTHEAKKDGAVIVSVEVTQ